MGALYPYLLNGTAVGWRLSTWGALSSSALGVSVGTCHWPGQQTRAEAEVGLRCCHTKVSAQLTLRVEGTPGPAGLSGPPQTEAFTLPCPADHGFSLSWRECVLGQGGSTEGSSRTVSPQQSLHLGYGDFSPKGSLSSSPPQRP